LRAALASPAERDGLRLDALFGMLRREFEGDPKHHPSGAAHIEALHYALARSVCVWLDEQGKLWPFYHAWRDGWRDDPTGERAFKSVMGATPKELNALWVEWAI
jgi:hypothetical protein